jgi:hypothetical protein
VRSTNRSSSPALGPFQEDGDELTPEQQVLSVYPGLYSLCLPELILSVGCTTKVDRD